MTLRDILAASALGASLILSGCRKHMEPELEVAQPQAQVAYEQRNAVQPSVSQGARLAAHQAPALDGFVLENDGDPKQGTVFLLYAYHPIDEATRPQILGIGNYQLAMLRKMEEIHKTQPISAIFPEEYAFTLTSFDDYPAFAVAKEQAKTLFSNDISAQPTDEQLDWLGRSGSYTAFGALHPGVPLCQTITLEESKRLEPLTAAELKKGINPDSPATCVEREKIASRYIADYLTKHPDSTVVWMFGWRHQHAKNRLLATGKNPRIYSWMGEHSLATPKYRASKNP
jgi:hypothetical protein